jgi:hypothetical protein
MFFDQFDEKAKNQAFLDISKNEKFLNQSPLPKQKVVLSEKLTFMSVDQDIKGGTNPYENFVRNSHVV